MRALFSLCVMAFAVSAAAEPSPSNQLVPAPPEAWISEHAAQVGIDDATVARIREIAAEERTAQAPLLTRLQEQKRALRDELGAEAPDERAVERSAREVGETETELEVLRLKSMLAVRRLLTPEQNAALLSRMQRRFEGRRALFGEALAACESEIAESCGEAEGPPHHKLGCLLHKPGVAKSEACTKALAKLPPPPPGPPGFAPHPRFGPPPGAGPPPGEAPAFAPR
jgi:Spy/CpxP family protein refolding chaperone